VQKEVDDHLKPKKPEPKEPVDPAETKYFRFVMCQPKQKEILSDYDRLITKLWEKKSNRRKNQTVLQLEEQPNQMVPPLKVLSKEDEATAQFVEETCLTKGQLRGEDEVPLHRSTGRKPFVMGQPLMWLELIDMLPTRMCELHEWYMKALAEGYVMLATRIKDIHFHRGMEDVWIDFFTIFSFYTIKTP